MKPKILYWLPGAMPQGETEVHREMKIAVKGAGAIGSDVGALLHMAGEDVTLLGRPDHVAAIRRHGLIVEGEYGGFVVPVKAAEELDFTPDLLLVATKVQDTAQACQQVKPHAMGVPTVMLQNGISGDEAAATVLDRGQIIGSMVQIAAGFLQPGVIERKNPGRLVLGEPFSRDTRRVQRIAAVLNRGIQTDVTDNLAGVRWGKLLINVQMTLQAAVGLGKKADRENPLLSWLALALTKEGLAVTDALDVRLEPVQGMPAGIFDAVRQLHVDPGSREVPPEALAASLFRPQAGKPNVASMLQSRLRGRPTEVDFINGDVVSFGKRVGVPTPLNQRMVDIMHELERTNRYLSPEELRSLLFAGGNGGKVPCW